MMDATTAGVAGTSLEVDRRHARQVAVIGVLCGSLVTLLMVALATGPVPFDYADLWRDSDSAELSRTVISEIRGPRVILAAIVGAALGLAGAALQGLFRNPLADPQLIGVSSGAALGAVAMIVLGSSIALPDAIVPFAVPAAAVSGAAATTLFLYAFASRYGRFSIVTMLLVGIAINAIALVGVGAFEYLSDDTQLRTLVFWLMGSFGKANWTTVLPVVVIVAAAMAVLLRQARPLDLFQLGEPEARHLGVDLAGVKRGVILASAAAVGAGVALSGIISFVGLVVPHLVRLLGGATHAFVLPGSALLGAILVVAADLIARMIVVPAEIPVGLVTSAIGGPFFLWLIARVRPQ